MSIRAIIKNDHDKFIDLIDKFYHSSAVLHTVPRENYDITFERCLNNDPFTACFVYEEDTTIKGYILLSFAYSNEVGSMVVWVEEIFVDDVFRNNGIGQKLLEFVHNKYDTYAKRFRLEATRDNERAIKLYESYGYKTLDYLQMVRDK